MTIIPTFSIAQVAAGEAKIDLKSKKGLKMFENIFK